METSEPRVRYRINVNRLAKGQMQFDCTCEVEATIQYVEDGAMNDLESWRLTALDESNKLVAALQERYPLALE